MLSLMLVEANIEQSLKFLQVLSALLRYDTTGEEIKSVFRLPNKEELGFQFQLDKGSVLHKTLKEHCTKDSFLVHTENPLKYLVLLLCLVTKTEKNYPTLKSAS